MANWPAHVKWHERDVVVPGFRNWLEAQGWETETETEFVDVVARRGSETIYAEVKGRTKSRPGAGLDALYGQLLRRMPAEEVGNANTRFAVVIPTGAEAAVGTVAVSRSSFGDIRWVLAMRLAALEISRGLER
jgi:hypothetical protein